MNLHQNNETFKDLIDLTAEKFSMPSLFIEKDYWVTYVLYNLYKSEYKDAVVFKGGTSLSKVYGLIDRFSEDVDLVIFDNGEERTLNQNRTLLSKIPKKIAIDPLEDLGQEHSDFRDTKGYKKRVYKYPKLDENNDEYGHARSELILEINFFIEPFPVLVKPVKTYIHEFLYENKNFETIKEFSLEPFDINVLCTSRTFYEKVLSLYRGAHKSIEVLKNRIRHFYDIYMLVTKDEKIKKEIEDKNAFITNLRNVIDDEKKHEMFCDIEEFLPLYTSSFSEHIIQLKEEIRNIYENSFSSMVYDKSKMPTFDEVYNKISSINDIIKEYKL